MEGGDVMKCECCGAISLEPVELTQRETEVLVYRCKGFTINEIAVMLKVKPYTVNDHTKAIYTKMGASNLAEMAVAAVRMGFAV